MSEVLDKGATTTALLRQQVADLRRDCADLQQALALHRAAIAAANLVPYQENLATDAFTYAGEGFAALTGYALGELRPSQLRALEQRAPAGGEETITTGIMAGLLGQRCRRYYRFQCRNGKLRWLADSSVIVLDAAGNAVEAIGILEDITARRLAEERVRASEENTRRLALVAARTNNIVILGDEQGRIEWVNDAFVRITGYSLEEVRGRVPGRMLQGPETDPATIERVRAALAAGVGIKCELVNYRRDGTPYWLDMEIQPLRNEQGQLTSFMAVEVDITARKNYEKQLARVYGELDAILRLIPGGIVAFNAADTVTYCNDTFARMLGLAIDQLRGMHASGVDKVLAALCAPDDPPYPLVELADGGYERIRLLHPAPAVLARTDREYRDGRGVREWHVVYLRDATHETEVDRLRTEFLTTAAHELRTPMSSVHGFSELLMSREFDAETSRTIGRTIHRQSSLLVAMVNDLLNLARIEAGGRRGFELKVQPLAPLVRETEAGLLMPDDARQVQVLPAAGDAASVNVDGAQLRQAITNVLANAYKYSRGQGWIRVSLPMRTVRGQAEVGISVEDQGIGMTPEQLSRAFERFYRADPSGDIPGTGLGLTLVQEVMEAMHGSVEIHSLPGRGTTVTLWLPVVSG